MRESDLEKLWEGDDQDLPNLKRLDLSRSKKLIKVPDLSLSPNIEEVILSGCESLTEVSSSSFLSKLNCLCLNGCVQLKSLHLPRNVLSRNLGLVVLYDCAKLELLNGLIVFNSD
ncbi:disease resistance protein RML1B [Trifolium pratense]|uniref:Uncharacterized protein n=1 Tax=Trifolium pratense TaxID=57577 RepID=A0ACB0LK54_TRIPR|nr:disease resistance protein RML1B [Trifolium pratense]CAJ2669778.1 unnamed protein product [Trifolium pratense]